MHRSVRRVTVTVITAALAAVGLAAAPSAAVAAAPTELFISEYVEGSSFNKALEIANPTEGPVDLTAGAYSVRMSFNGGTSVANIPLTGTVVAGGVHVVAQSAAGAAVLAAADQTSTTNFFNGDDAIMLMRGDTVVDSIGQLGVDPGTEWGAGLTSTADNTLRRAETVCVGDSNPSDSFDPSSEWIGFAQDTFDGLGSHTADCDGTPPPVVLVINEFSASTTGTDVEYVELLGTVGADLSAYRVLEIEGDGESNIGTVDEAISFATPADGRALASLAADSLENGTMSLLLVRDFTGVLGGDVDADDDGELDAAFPGMIVDSVAVLDGAPGDIPYGGVVLDAGDGGFGDVAPGGASRIHDGTDTDSPADWVRNDFDLAGIPDFTGTPVVGEALNTPGAANALVEVQVPLCEAPTVTIGSVQGSGAASPVVGSTVDVEGVVTGDFQATGELSGYYLQDGGDDSAATSDGIFIFAPSGVGVASGDLVHVRGAVSEFNGLTEITAGSTEVCGTGATLPAARQLQLPADDVLRESLESMYVALSQSLVINDLFTYGRFGELSLAPNRQFVPTAVVEPGAPTLAYRQANLAARILLDDGLGVQNPDTLRHPNGQPFSATNSLRTGDQVVNATGVLDWRFAEWRVQPTQAAGFMAANPRPAVAPVVGGTMEVSSYNVLNYFTSIGPDSDFYRGANTQAEFDRQEAKIVAALAAIDADVFGLIEIENNDGLALDTLVAALNAEVGPGTYAAIDTGQLGTDRITNALIYKPARVTPLGAYAKLDSSVDVDFRANNRPALAQTFTEVGGSERVTVVVNHLKSKGTACTALGDPDTGDGQGNCNITRTLAAGALVDWLATDPTAQGTVGRELIIGDLNSYDHEDPIDALRAGGYTDLLLRDQGEFEYSYNFDGESGYLDHALAGAALTGDVTKAAAWHINSDESALYDYNVEFKNAALQALWAPDPYRSSDHDPVVIGLDLTPPDTTAPTLELTADPAFIFPANGKLRTVTIDVDVADESGTVAVQFLGATALGSPKAAVEQVSANEFRVAAAKGAVYTFRYEARDGAGNTTTKSTVVIVGKG